MLNDLRKLLESEQSDDILDLMLEATNDALVDFFIEDDGEAEIDEKEVNAILSKIPAYDEEEAMNKKLEKITECYIPESLTYVEEGFINKMKLNKLSKEELEEKMRNLENEIEDLNHYVNSDEGTKQHEKRLSKAKKELAEVEKIYKKKNSVQESVKSDGECP
jgi:TolA-binding protein